MTKKIEPSPVSSYRAAMDAVPNSVLFSTEPLGWRQVNVQRRIRPLGGITEIPEGMAEHVILVWHGPTHVTSLLGGTRQEANASRGTTQFVPARTPVLWDRRSPFRFTKVSLRSECTDALMLDLFDRDPVKRPLVPRATHEDPVFRASAHALVSHALSEDPANELVVDEIAQQLAVHLIATYGGAPVRWRGAQPLSPNQWRRVAEYVEANVDQPITLEALAEVTCISKYHFLRRFKLSTGLTPHQFVIERRIARAKELILADRFPLAQIAHASGFSDQAHFTRIFKRAVGITPKAFRQGG